MSVTPGENSGASQGQGEVLTAASLDCVNAIANALERDKFTRSPDSVTNTTVATYLVHPQTGKVFTLTHREDENGIEFESFETAPDGVIATHLTFKPQDETYSVWKAEGLLIDERTGISDIPIDPEILSTTVEETTAQIQESDIIPAHTAAALRHDRPLAIHTGEEARTVWRTIRAASGLILTSAFPSTNNQTEQHVIEGWGSVDIPSDDFGLPIDRMWTSIRYNQFGPGRDVQIAQVVFRDHPFEKVGTFLARISYEWNGPDDPKVSYKIQKRGAVEGQDLEPINLPPAERWKVMAAIMEQLRPGNITPRDAGTPDDPIEG